MGRDDLKLAAGVLACAPIAAGIVLAAGPRLYAAGLALLAAGAALFGWALADRGPAR